MAYPLSPFLPHTFLDTQTATTASGILLLKGQCARLTLYLTSVSTTSGGTIAIEEAYYAPDQPVYAGTWSLLQTVNASAFTGGATIAYHFEGSFWAVRVRVATTITGGGTVTVVGWGN